MDIELGTILSGVCVIGIGAILAWTFKTNARLARIEAKMESNSGTMKKHSGRIKKNEDGIHAVQLTLAEQRGVRRGSTPDLRPHGGGNNS